MNGKGISFFIVFSGKKNKSMVSFLQNKAVFTMNFWAVWSWPMLLFFSQLQILITE